MDAAGKDSVIKHVMSGLNPQGCQVWSFKSPSDEEVAHDFLWRSSKALPTRGLTAIFNRSYYEEVLVVRVHPALLERQRLPGSALAGNIWQRRFNEINAFEGLSGRQRDHHPEVLFEHVQGGTEATLPRTY